MDGFLAYKYFTALKIHFTNEKYDVFESRGAVSGSRETFNKRNDRMLYEKLANKFETDRELVQFLVSNIAYGHTNVVYSVESDDYYQAWMKRKQSITRVFEQDMQTILKHFEKNNLKGEELYSVEEYMPELLKLYLGGFVTLESMSILQDFDDYLRLWEPLIMLFTNKFLVIKKIKGFVKYNSVKIQPIYQDFKDSLNHVAN